MFNESAFIKSEVALGSVVRDARYTTGFIGSNAKNSPLEGGHRMPFFVVWIDQFNPGMTNELAIIQDMLATFAAVVGTEVSKDQAEDSKNLLPLLNL